MVHDCVEAPIARGGDGNLEESINDLDFKPLARIAVAPRRRQRAAEDVRPARVTRSVRKQRTSPEDGQWLQETHRLMCQERVPAGRQRLRR